jgi:hypothetical protein
MPAEDVFKELQSGLYSSEYFDLFNIPTSKINPLQSVVPCFDLDEDNKIKDFYGPYALNIICFTGPYTKGTDPSYSWDSDDVDKCKDILKKAYSRYARYELHFIMDSGSPVFESPTPATQRAINFTESALDGLASDLSNYGVFYWGELKDSDLSEKIQKIIRDFYTATVED